MMQIPYRLLPSKIHGLGVFAAAPVQMGTLIWRYVEPTDFRLDVIPDDLKEHASRHGYIPPGKNYTEFPGDGAMFINHSDQPNVSTPDGGDMFANRDIQAGEELTADYREFDQFPNSYEAVTEE